MPLEGKHKTPGIYGKIASRESKRGLEHIERGHGLGPVTRRVKG